MADNHEDRIAKECDQLLVDIARLGTKTADGKATVKVRREGRKWWVGERAPSSRRAPDEPLGLSAFSFKEPRPSSQEPSQEPR